MHRKKFRNGFYRGLPIGLLLCLFIPSAACAAEMGARILSVTGRVLSRESENGSWEKAKTGRPLSENAQIAATGDSSCMVSFGAGEKNILKVDADSILSVGSVEPARLELKSGKILAFIRQLDKRSSFEVKTPVAVAAVRGTAWAQSPDAVWCFKGQVHLETISGAQADLSEGQAVALAPNGTIGAATALGDAAVSEWQAFAKTVREDFTRDEFVSVKSNKEKSELEIYTKKSKEDYTVRTTAREGKNSLIFKLKDEFVESGRETIRFEEGAIEEVEVIYSDLTGRGTRDIAELRVVSSETLSYEASDSEFGVEIKTAGSPAGGSLNEPEAEQESQAPLPPEANPVDQKIAAEIAAAAAAAAHPVKSTTTWNAVTTAGFGSANNTNIPAMAQFRSAFYAGTTNTVNGAQLFRSTNGTTWSNVSGAGTFSSGNGINALMVFPYPETSSSKIYMGTGVSSTASGAGSVTVSSDGAVWSALSDATKWSVDTSDGQNDAPSVTALAVAGSYLYAGISFERHNCEIWRRSVADDIASWVRVVSKDNILTMTGGSRYGIVNDLKYFNGKIYAALELASGSAGPVMISSSTGDSGSWAMSGTRGFA